MILIRHFLFFRSHLYMYVCYQDNLAQKNRYGSMRAAVIKKLRILIASLLFLISQFLIRIIIVLIFLCHTGTGTEISISNWNFEYEMKIFVLLLLLRLKLYTSFPNCISFFCVCLPASHTREKIFNFSYSKNFLFSLFNLVLH